tara:strand:- start:142 stop:744 length:603 start_codon:yes stop_codon:yes gene_type:complete
MQLFLRGLRGDLSAYDCERDDSLASLKERVQEREFSGERFEEFDLVTSQGRWLTGCGDEHASLDELGVHGETTIHVRLLIRGGKGGYGALLRIQSKRKGNKQTTDFGACRDLTGRRLRHVNDEKIIEKWKEAKGKGDKYDPSTASGIDNWYLMTPSWADIKKPNSHVARQQATRKSVVCQSWLDARAARADGKAPSKAGT